MSKYDLGSNIQVGSLLENTQVGSKNIHVGSLLENIQVGSLLENLSLEKS